MIVLEWVNLALNLLITAMLGYGGWRFVIKKLNWQHDTIVPWINSTYQALGKPPLPDTKENHCP